MLADTVVFLYVGVRNVPKVSCPLNMICKWVLAVENFFNKLSSCQRHSEERGN